MASTSTNVENQTPPEITFYLLGQPIPSSKLPTIFVDTVLATARRQFANIVPTTYEASKAYLDEEILKPEGNRDLRREMGMIVVMEVPDNEEVFLMLDVMKALIPLQNGSMILYPTVDLPPTAFGTLEDERGDMLMGAKTGRRVQASISLVYFSRTGDTTHDSDYVGGNMSNKIQVDSSPLT